MKTEELINKAKFFQGLSDENRRVLAGICQPKEIRKKQVLFLQGEEGEALYLLDTGTIGLCKTKPDGKETMIRMVQPGEIFAEVILFGNRIYPVTATAITNSYVYMIHKDKFHTLLDRTSFRNDFIHLLLKKQRYLTNQILYLTTHDVEERLFLFLNENFGEKEEIPMKYSKRELASAVSTTPETFSRLLLNLKKSRTMDWKDKTIMLKMGFWKEWKKQQE